VAGVLGWTILAALGYVVGGSIVWFKKNWSSQGLTMLVALSTGLLLAVSIGGMLPHGLSETPSQAPWLLVGMLAAFAFQRWHTKHRLSSKNEMEKRQGAVWSVLSGMGIHAYFEGFAIGAGFHVDPRFGIAVLLALVLHKIPEGVAISTLTMAGFQERKKAMGAAGILGICTVLGTITALWIADLPWMQGQLAGIALLFSAGILLYVAGTELWPVINRVENYQTVLCFLSGILLYYLLGWGSMLIAPIHQHHEVSANPAHTHDTSHHHLQPVEIPKGMPVPTVHLLVRRDSESGWNLHVQTTHFRFTPELINGPNRIGEGHAHLFVDGKKVARLYGPWYHLDHLGPGKHEIRVGLFTNQHAPYAHLGEKIEDTAIVVENE
jgi:zinc transporter ZupT